MQDAIELSVVVPCRNEHETIGSTIAEIETMLADLECPAEIIAVDNNSSDASGTIIAGTSARLVKEPMPGYGAALKRGIAESRGRFVIFGDADASYDFSQSPAMLHRLQRGDSLVLGCRLPAGNGNIEPGAMPWLHRHLGNPAISWLCRRLFSVPVHDVYCGLRGFARADYEKLSINSTSRKARAWARPRGDMVALGPSAFIFLSHHGMEEGRCFTVMECYGRPPMLNYASK